MPANSKAKNPRGIEINFVEKTHKYYSIIDGKEINYTSGTTFVDRFFPKFDPDGSITRRCALREGISEEELRNRWREKSRKSCEYGTKIHETMEDRLLGRPLRNSPSDDREKLVFETTEKLSRGLLDKMEIVGIEKIIFDEKLKIAGTVDLLARSKKSGKLFILDHKTNETIDMENKYSSFGLPPISHIMNTNFGHYTMQLNLYRYLLRKCGYFDEDIGMALLHITDLGHKCIPIENHEKDIENMIEIFGDEL